MSFIIHSDAGETFVIDGGIADDVNNIIKRVKSYGGTVDGWFLTHYHEDHINAFNKIFSDEKLRKQITLKTLYYNFPARDEIIEYAPEDSLDSYDKFYEVLPFVNCHSCLLDDFYNFEYPSVNIEVLRYYNCTANRITTNFGNNSGAVLRFNMNEYKMVFLGDLGIEGGQELLELYSPEELDCDFVQVAHHGQGGVGQEVYSALNPEFCFWPTPKWLWDNMGANGYNTGNYTTLKTRSWMDELETVNFVNKDGEKTLYITEQGLVY